MEMVAVQDISFTYPGRKTPVLDNISFEVKRGEFILVCGSSGCGKTTLLRLLKHTLAPIGNKSGGIYYQGVEVGELSERELTCDIGYVMQSPETQIVTDKVWHELAFGLENMGMDNRKIRTRVGEMANFFGIHEWFHRKTTELSGGQKQMLNLASVMVMQPSLLLLDEPTSQLDPIAASDFILTIHKLNRDLGVTVIMAEHRYEEVFPLVDKVAVLRKSNLSVFASPRSICLQPDLFSGGGALHGLPSAVRIFHATGGRGDCPLTVREGREYLDTVCNGESRGHPNTTCNEQAAEKIPRETSAGHAPAAPAKKNAALSAKDVWFRYEKDGCDVLSGVSLQLEEGEIVSILGGNGSGKTTLLGALTGENRPYRGKVRLSGVNITKLKSEQLFRRNLALLPQNPQLLFIKDSVIDDFYEIGKVMGQGPEAILEETKRILDFLGVGHLLKSHPYDLSGGEQQKIALGKLLLLKPRILLLDEPTKGLDPAFKQELISLLRSLRAGGIAVLMVTHDVEFAAEISDRCGLFFDGRILSMSEPREFFAGNSFYTTVANRIAQHIDPNAVTCEDVVRSYFEMRGGKVEV